MILSTNQTRKSVLSLIIKIAAGISRLRIWRLKVYGRPRACPISMRNVSTCNCQAVKKSIALTKRARAHRRLRKTLRHERRCYWTNDF